MQQALIWHFINIDKKENSRTGDFVLHQRAHDKSCKNSLIHGTRGWARVTMLLKQSLFIKHRFQYKDYFFD